MADGCIGPINIIPDNNEVILQDVNQTITVVDNNCCTTVNVTQPTTEVVQILAGAYIPAIISASYSTTASYALTASYFEGLLTDRITSGEVEAVVSNTGSFFLIRSGSNVFQQVDLTGSTTFTTDADTVFLIKNFGNNPIFTVSQSGMLILATHSIELISSAPVGGIYFTSNSFFVGLE